jgi:hypothetical protein
MMTNKRMKVFLLLGVMILSLIASGCAPGQGTQSQTPQSEASTLKTVTFHELVDIENVSELRVYTMVLSTPHVVKSEEILASFFESNLENALFIKAVEEASGIVEDIMDESNLGGRLKLYFLDTEGVTIASLYVNDNGAALLKIGDEQYVTPKSQPLSYEGIGASMGWTLGNGGT